jgi:WD40 repeat protein
MIIPLLYSVVCCVQFSPDGKYVATGCNRSARVYDAKTGLQKWYVISLRHIKKVVDGTLTLQRLLRIAFPNPARACLVLST